MSNASLLTAVLLSAIITFALRAVPFVLFGRKREIPALIKRLGDLLPYAVIACLVVYCLKDIPTSGFADNLKLLAAVAAVAAVHAWKRHTILSVAVGTALYIILLHV